MADEKIRNLLVEHLGNGGPLAELVQAKSVGAGECPNGCAATLAVDGQDPKFCQYCGHELYRTVGQGVSVRKKGLATVRGCESQIPLCALDGHHRVQRTARGLVVREGKRFAFRRVCEDCAGAVDEARVALGQGGAKPGLLKILQVYSRKDGVARCAALNNPPVRKERPAHKSVATATKEIATMTTPNGSGTTDNGNTSTASATEPETSRTPTVEVPAVAAAEGPVTPIPGAPEPTGRRVTPTDALRHSARVHEDDIGRQIDFEAMVDGFAAFLRRDKDNENKVKFVDGDVCNVDHVIHGERNGKVEIQNAIVLGDRLVRLCSRATAACYMARDKVGLEKGKGLRPMPLRMAEARVAERKEYRRLVELHQQAGRNAPLPESRETCGIDHKGCGPVIRWTAIPDAQAHRGRVVGFCEMACDAFCDAGFDGKALLTEDKNKAERRAQEITVEAPWVNRKRDRNDGRGERRERKEYSVAEMVAAKQKTVADLEARAAKGEDVRTALLRERQLLQLVLKKQVAENPAPTAEPVVEAPKPVRDPKAQKAKDRKPDGEDGEDGEDAGLKAIAQEREKKGKKAKSKGGGTPSGDPDGNEHAATTIGEAHPVLAALRDQLPSQ